MEAIDITRDEETRRKLEVLDIKMDKLISIIDGFEKDLKELQKERKEILLEFYRKCENSASNERENSNDN